MNRVPIGSTSVISAGYDPDALVLEVEFPGGGVYQYFDVPQTVYDEFTAAESKGTFVNSVIKRSYRYARL